jgi:hypothetical protein
MEIVSLWPAIAALQKTIAQNQRLRAELWTVAEECRLTSRNGTQERRTREPHAPFDWFVPAAPTARQ